MGFLKFLFISILVLWVIRIIAARLLPWILRRFATKMQEQVFREFDAQSKQRTQTDARQQNKKAEGKINIDYIPPQPSNQSGPKKAGEFVDFEEIK